MKYRLIVFKVEGDTKSPLAVHYYSNKYDMLCDIVDWIDNSQDGTVYEFCKLIDDPLKDKL